MKIWHLYLKMIPAEWMMKWNRLGHIWITWISFKSSARIIRKGNIELLRHGRTKKSLNAKVKCSKSVIIWHFLIKTFIIVNLRFFCKKKNIQLMEIAFLLKLSEGLFLLERGYSIVVFTIYNEWIIHNLLILILLYFDNMKLKYWFEKTCFFCWNLMKNAYFFNFFSKNFQGYL